MSCVSEGALRTAEEDTSDIQKKKFVEYLDAEGTEAVDASASSASTPEAGRLTYSLGVVPYLAFGHTTTGNATGPQTAAASPHCPREYSVPWNDTGITLSKFLSLRGTGLVRSNSELESRCAACGSPTPDFEEEAGGLADGYSYCPRADAGLQGGLVSVLVLPCACGGARSAGDVPGSVCQS